jgi:cell division protein FtsX
MAKKGEMKTVTKLNVLSVAKITALFGVVLGLLNALTLVLNPLADQVIQQTFAIAISKYWFLLILPVIFLIAYFLFGIIGSVIYNLLAKWIGGVKIELK